MKTRVLNGLNTEEQSDLSQQWAGSGRLRRRIVDLLNEDIESIHASMRTDVAEGSASWPYSQAAKLGEVKALLKIISLFS